MIVCHCHAVTDREIRATVRDGARTCHEVASACGAGSGCGGCASLVSEIVQGLAPTHRAPEGPSGLSAP